MDAKRGPAVLSSSGHRLLIRSRLYPKECSLVLGGQHVQESIRSLTYIADALMQIAQHRLAANFLPAVVEDNPLPLTGSGNLPLSQAADEHVSLPRGEAIAGVESHPLHAN